MIEILFARSDLAGMRFAHSPVGEPVTSLRLLQDPGRQLKYGLNRAAVSRRFKILHNAATGHCPPTRPDDALPMHPAATIQRPPSRPRKTSHRSGPRRSLTVLSES